jgi:hypothetical protein
MLFRKIVWALAGRCESEGMPRYLRRMPRTRCVRTRNHPGVHFGEIPWWQGEWLVWSDKVPERKMGENLWAANFL